MRMADSDHRISFGTMTPVWVLQDDLSLRPERLAVAFAATMRWAVAKV
jgi:hypothetical protein